MRLIFSLKLKVNLNNIKKYSYLFEVKAIPQINKIDIWCELYRLWNTTLNLNNYQFFDEREEFVGWKLRAY